MPNIKRTMKEKSNIVSVHFDAHFFFERGVRYFYRHELEKAYKYLSRSIDLDPTNPEYALHLAAVLTEMGQFKSSNDILQTIQDLPQESIVECDYYMANNYAHLYELEKAEEHILRYLHRNEDGLFNDEAEELLDYVCYELERGPQPLNMNRELDERHEKARRCLERGQFVRATKLLEKLIDDYPDFMAARNNLSLAYYYMGQFNDALRVMADVFHYEPSNLHALCNLAIFYSHQSQDEKAKPVIDGLKKVQPLHIDHCYKLATTLGILKEDERAFELFLMLSKKGMDRDPCLFHYLAVACFNTGRWHKARESWRKVRDLDSSAGIADYYLTLLNEHEEARQHEKARQGRQDGEGCSDVHGSTAYDGVRLSYHYQLPYDVKWKKKEWLEDGEVPEELLHDPLVRSSLFWSLKHGDQDTKLQVIQSLQFFADEEVQEALRQLILNEREEDYVKKVAVFVLRQMGAPSPYVAHLEGRKVKIDGTRVDEKFPVWMAHWQKVIHCLQRHMEGKYDLMEHQQAQTIWTKFLRVCHPDLPKIRKAEAWAAAIEYLVAQNSHQPCTKKEMAKKYGVTVNTLSRNLYQIEKSILADGMHFKRT